jgi:hypothetical protein
VAVDKHIITDLLLAAIVFGVVRWLPDIHKAATSVITTNHIRHLAQAEPVHISTDIWDQMGALEYA